MSENFKEDAARTAPGGSLHPACCAAPPVMSEQEFDEIMERTNQACIEKYGKTFCELEDEIEKLKIH